MASKTLINGTGYEIFKGKALVDGTGYEIFKGKTLIDGTAHEIAFGGKEITDSWAVISKGTNLSKYKIGDWKSITLSDGGILIMEIAAFNADTKVNGTQANITWISKYEAFRNRMTYSTDKTGGWGSAQLRTYLQDTFYKKLPNELKDVIVTVNKTYWNCTTEATESCFDNVWLPSLREIHDTGSGYSSHLETEGPRYSKYFTDISSRRKTNSNGESTDWWLRTMFHSSASTDTGFMIITNSGSMANKPSSNLYGGVVPCFCT